MDFLHQAMAQRESRGMQVEDGWLYFLHGWTQVIAEVLKVKIEGALFDKLSVIASEICTPALQQAGVRQKAHREPRGSISPW